MTARRGNGLSFWLQGSILAACLSACGPSADGPAPRPLLVTGSLGVTLGKLQQPRAIAVEPRTGRFYVVDRSGRIQLFEADGQPILEWRLPEQKLGQPVGMALEADGNLLVNDSHYHRLLRYGPGGGKVLAQWGSEGTGPGQFTFGRDVVVDSEGFIFAGDYGGLNDRILKFAPDGTFLLEWGGRGEEPGKFQRPQGMAMERREGEETLLVADCANHRVQRFSRAGRWLFAFGRVGRGAGELRYPSSVAVTSDGSILVSEWGNNRIQRFDARGRSLGVWGRAGRAPGELATPWDVAVGPGDRIYVADYGNHRVQVFLWPDLPRQAAATPPAPASLPGAGSSGGH